MKELRSRDPVCRVFGCTTSGPYYGMPLAHCWKCGMKTYSAAEWCDDYELPIEPRSKWFKKLVKWLFE